ncbi:MAG: hypothetical protein EZS28_049746 [Streblomastix strix]|uniref:Uncharacterized protein n=1 Tax=Streblomastix strix TaxID=222440 RepID=A0A5J4T965_9EUKA|nr:MAG: hypothetical protein EZS28_049746 [Streblomastix strix]
MQNEIESEDIELDEYEENEEEWFWDSFDMQDTPIQNEKEKEKVMEKDQIIKEKEGSKQNIEAEKVQLDDDDCKTVAERRMPRVGVKQIMLLGKKAKRKRNDEDVEYEFQE